MIVILDYGMGNLGSIQNMFKRIGVKSIVSSDKKDLERAQKVILPGVGAFDKAIEALKSGQYIEILEYKAREEKVPFLGICLGMQLLTRKSEEGVLPGFGWIDAETRKITTRKSELRVPHMGWSKVRSVNKSKITNGFDGQYKFYFTHSYCVQVKENRNSILKADYGTEFDACIQEENVYGAQFHPEKSHKYGMKFLKNFSDL